MADRRSKMKARSLERGSSAPQFPFNKTSTVTGSTTSINSTCSDVAKSTGHEFKKKTYYSLTYCHHCSEMLWGLKNQGYQCTVCNYVSHEKCLSSIIVDCTHLISEQIVSPVAHDWLGPKTATKKKKWCNVCRKRINGPVHFCKVCRRYAHGQCTEHSMNNCKECATYTSVATNVSFEHRWIEGNLPSSAKCELCLKSCYTDLSLTGFRCGWCGLTLHSCCLDTYTLKPSHNKCTFRDLSYLILPPSCISLPINSSTLTQQHDKEDDIVDDKDVTELFSDEEDTKSRPVIVIDSSNKSDTTGGGGGGGGEGEGRRGSKRWRKRSLHPIYVDNKMTASELLRISLRKCSIPYSTEQFYLVLSETETEISSNDIIYNICPDITGPLKLYIRKRDSIERTFEMKIYNSKLSTQKQFVTMVIDEHTTARAIIEQAITLFELTDSGDNTNYCLYEVNQTRGVTERILQDSESPWKQIQELKKDSFKSVSQLRYYLHCKERLCCSFYLWKINSLHLKDQSTILQYLTQYSAVSDDTIIELGPTFPKLGALIVNIHCPTTAELFYTNVCSKGDISIIIIPTIKEELLSAEKEPLLIFINGKSGGNQGVELLSGFSRHLNPHQVYDLSAGGPLPGLYLFRNVLKYRILVGGGDGTVGWVLSALDMMRDYLKEPTPPCAVLPLGTGNDLARALKWGPGYSGEKLMSLLYSIEDADMTLFDRWSVQFKEDPDLTSEGDKTGDIKTVIMNNYIGIGIDAEIALGFHQAREDNPEKFNSRLHNKGVYLQLGVQKTFSRDTTVELHTCVSVKVDDKLIRLPTGLKGIVLLNIESWGAGSEPWGSDSDECFVKNSYNDGILEVMGLSGAMHIGQIKSSLRNGIRIAQGKKILITLSTPITVQVDGEAWDQLPCIMDISALPYQSKLLCKSLRPSFRRGLSDNEAKSLVSKQNDIHSPLGMSSRRDQHFKKGVSSTTLYVKLPPPDDDTV